MKSTTRPTSRTKARIITPATWRWCARISQKFRSCWRRRRRRSRPRSMRARAAISAWRCRRGSAASTCRISRRSICGAKPPRARPLHLAAARRAIQDRDRAARAGAVVPQSPRLRAADAVPRLRASLCLHHLRCLAGRSSLSPAAGLPPLRLLDAAPARLSALRGRGIAGRGRARRRAPAGGSGGAVPGRAHHGAVERSHHLDRDHAHAS